MKLENFHRIKLENLFKLSFAETEMKQLEQTFSRKSTELICYRPQCQKKNYEQL